MKYTVLWTPRAERQLAAIWLDAPDRQAITQAANWLDSTLKSSPDSTGESREDDVRIAFAPPLAIVFDVSQQDRMVHVMAVWTIT